MVTRREFLAASSGLLAGTAALGPQLWAGQAPSPAMLGIQVGAVSFVDEGTEKLLDGLQEMASINTLFLACFTYGRGIGGRQPQPHPLPDHGKQEYDVNFHGGNFATPHPEFYKNTRVEPQKAPDHPGNDMLADVIPKAKKRKMKCIAWYEDVFHEKMAHIEGIQQITPSGEVGLNLCLRNPDVRQFWLALTEDYLRSYDLDGIMWGSERQGPLNNLLYANHNRPGREIGCFCQHCQVAAKDAGVSFARAREGFLKLLEWRANLAENGRPVDGAFVTFWRLLLRYPEVLAWQNLWNEGLRDTYRDLYALARSLAPDKLVGWHIWHLNSFSPFYRAEQDYAEFSRYSDFLKVVMYNKCGGPRMASYIRNMNQTLLADLASEQALQLSYSLLGYENEKPFDQIMQEGFSADYVAREVKRAAATVDSHVRIWPGIDIDIPTNDGEKKTQPEDVYQSVTAAFGAGTHGVILSRKYSEMKLDNLRAAGRAIREQKLG
ncbi:MAG: family 10 glycosylhydrolase [bacterium]